ncbi:MAG TPA: prepilin peptidase [Candidatus Eremiobacteraceae bacterium]|jgi:leader peptidase (prepilin peptidase)/N-methyltransferase|nr:prepilin peptidase [Candidatus Eremiobacteraceae bacterium]
MLGAITAAAGGLIVGSFLNVVIYRLPRGESLLFPGSHCGACHHALGALDNIPLLSWIALRGRCRYCGAPIGLRYPLVETLSAAVFALAFLEFGISVETLAACLFGALLIVIAFVDLDHLLVLDSTTIAGGVAGIGVALATHRIVDALEGAAAAAAIFGAIYALTRGAGMGFGDVKLAAMIGLFVGFPTAIWASAAAFIIGAALALPVVLARRRGRRDALPFGPFLVIAATLATFAPAVLRGPYDAYRSLLNN